jgi:ADP-heptose:LPS heptosyltransferase
MCAALSVWRILAQWISSPFRHNASTTPKKILFLELSEMGSAIIAHSALDLAKRQYPDADLFFMVFSKNQESVSLLGVIPEENLVLVDASSFKGLALSTLQALRRLRRLRIDTVVDLELFSRFTAMVSYLSGAKTRVGFHNYTAEGLYRGSLITHKVFYNPHQHMELNFLALVRALAAPPDQTPMLKEDVRPFRVPLPRHTPTTHEINRLWGILHAEQPALSAQHRLLVVNPDPGDALPIRGWALDRYVQTVEKLLVLNEDLYCVVIGLKASKPYAQALQDSLGRERVLDLTGKTKTLRDVVTLFTFSDLLITNDSGPAHFAALTEIRSIALFGPETPALYGALGEGKKNIWANYSCSPCLSAHNHRHTVCKDSLCLKAIEVGPVVAEAQSLLTEVRKSKISPVRIAV